MKNRTKRGFTIVELVIVIAVIAVLSAVLIPTFSGIISKANDSKAIQNARNAYTEYLIDVAQNPGIPNDFIYVADTDRYVAIKDGSVGEVYKTRDEALVAIVGDQKDDYKLVATSTGSKLLAIYLRATIDNFLKVNVDVKEEKIIEDDAETVEFDIYYETLGIASASVPKTALVDPTKPVTVTITTTNPDYELYNDENTVAYAYDINVSNIKDADAFDEGEYITIVLNAPTALPSVTVHHNGEEIDKSLYTYDEVNGTITIKTRSFSPYAVSYLQYEASTLAELRDYTAINNAYVKLTADIKADMDTDADRNAGTNPNNHRMYYSDPGKYVYNVCEIDGTNVTIDLNGHTIEAYGHPSTTYSLLVVREGSSLNITDTAGGQYLKISIGKGNLTIDELIYMIERYSSFI